MRILSLLAVFLLTASCQQQIQTENPMESRLRQGQDPMGRPLLEVELELLERLPESGEIQLLSAPRLTVWEGTRANMTVLNQQAYLAHFEVEYSPEKKTALADPVVAVFEDGVKVDVLPHRMENGFWGGAVTVSLSHLREMEKHTVQLGDQKVEIQIPDGESRTRYLSLEGREEPLWFIGLGKDFRNRELMVRIRYRQP